MEINPISIDNNILEIQINSLEEKKYSWNIAEQNKANGSSNIRKLKSQGIHPDIVRAEYTQLIKEADRKVKEYKFHFPLKRKECSAAHKKTMKIYEKAASLANSIGDYEASSKIRLKQSDFYDELWNTSLGCNLYLKPDVDFYRKYGSKDCFDFFLKETLKRIDEHLSKTSFTSYEYSGINDDIMDISLFKAEILDRYYGDNSFYQELVDSINLYLKGEEDKFNLPNYRTRNYDLPLLAALLYEKLGKTDLEQKYQKIFDDVSIYTEKKRQERSASFFICQMELLKFLALKLNKTDLFSKLFEDQIKFIEQEISNLENRIGEDLYPNLPFDTIISADMVNRNKCAYLGFLECFALFLENDNPDQANAIREKYQAYQDLFNDKEYNAIIEGSKNELMDRMRNAKKTDPIEDIMYSYTWVLEGSFNF